MSTKSAPEAVAPKASGAKNGSGKGGSGKSGSGKSSRRRSREFALQGLYQWQLSAAKVEAIESELAEASGFAKLDGNYFRAILRGAIDQAPELDAAMQPYLDRKVQELSPIERAILLIGGYELKHHLDVPYRVVINEAVELAKTFGGTDGHKYVNGVLDKLAGELRAAEIADR
jgi:N utilization substance protein B